jgi:hypothetical protein
MFIAVDIDETIARGHDAPGFLACVRHYRDTLGLEIPETVADFHSLYQMPAVMQTHSALPGAVEGVHRLAQLGQVAYYTVRKHADPVVAQEVQNVTRQWLRDQGFPNPDNVVFCRSAFDKLAQLYERERDQNCIALIDDRFRKIVEQHEEARVGRRSHIAEYFLRAPFTLVAFGVHKVDILGGLHVVPMSSWQGVGDIYDRFTSANLVFSRKEKTHGHRDA